VFSKYFGGNKESAIWEAAALQERGFEIDRPFLESIEKDQLDFNELADFKIPDVALSDIEEAIKSYCSEVNIFEEGTYFRSALMDRFYRLEKTKNLDSLLTNKIEIYSLNLSYSNLKELPETLLQFKNLEYLNLSGNRFKDKERLFNDLAKLPNLKILELNRCYLRALPDNVKNLKGLIMLSLRFNDFRALNENIGALTRLKYLDIGSNGKLRDLPESIGNLKCLQMLDISPNGMRRLRDELANCTELVSIVANAGTIKTLPEDIGNLINLKHLNLAANKIIVLPNSIGGLSSLEGLSLGTNDIEVLPKSFSNLKNLDYCGVSYNRFKEFPEPVLGLKNVQNLWLHNNGFKTIPAEVANLPKLTHLLIDHEIITDENIKAIKSVNSELRVIKQDSRKLVKGRKRKI
jgi:Leucine-rich repeat (LRR) protein